MYPQKHFQNALWHHLLNVVDFHIPTLLIGDFSCILNLNERVGYSQTLSSYILNFQSFISSSGLKEVPAKGNFFTWTNNHQPGKRVWAKLDRAFYNSPLLNLFPHAFLDIFPIYCWVRDHSPIIFNTSPDLPIPHNLFRFQAFWFKQPGFKQILDSAWKYNCTNEPIQFFTTKFWYIDSLT